MKEQEIKKVFHNKGHVHFSTKYILTLFYEIAYVKRIGTYLDLPHYLEKALAIQYNWISMFSNSVFY